MIDYQQRFYWNATIFVLSVLISFATLFYTQTLVSALSREQRKMVNLLAKTYEQLNEIQSRHDMSDISFLFEIIKSNENIPLIMTDSTGNQILDYINLDSNKVKKPGYLERQLQIMKSQHKPIPIEYSNAKKILIYYKSSRLITQLKIYPIIQLFLVILFIAFAYYAFNSSRKYEQNKVWTGMSRETAHQLGTPVSSLMALSENIKSLDLPVPDSIIRELDKDIHRLEVITDRFSKIGTLPKPEKRNLYREIKEVLDYLAPRVSSQIAMKFDEKSNLELNAYIIPSLFAWVIENLCKNAINAMEGKGEISVLIHGNENVAFIDITDTGKGIPRSKFKTIFKAGYTTSRSGWGLGLSLSKRIIEMYHKGELYVKWSEPGKGSTFRIKLKNPQRKKIFSF